MTKKAKEGFTIKEVLEKYMDEMKDQVNDIHSDVKDIKLKMENDSGRISKLEGWQKGIIWIVGIMVTLIYPFFKIAKVEFIKLIDTRVSLLQEPNSDEK